jgi:hypothetical protein
MSINWEDFLKEVMPDVMGCPIRVAENAIRNAAIDFCNESRAWRDDCADVPTVQGTAEYTLVPPTDGEVVAVYYAKFSDSNIPLSTIPEQHIKRGRQNPIQQKPKWFHAPTPGVIELFWTPDEIHTLSVKAILKPTKSSTNGPDFLYNDWLEVIAHGAKARLVMMSGREWFMPKMYTYYKKEFIKGWTDARIRDSKSNVQSSTRLRPGYFGTYRGAKSI